MMTKFIIVFFALWAGVQARTVEQDEAIALLLKIQKAMNEAADSQSAARIADAKTMLLEVVPSLKNADVTGPVTVVIAAIETIANVLVKMMEALTMSQPISFDQSTSVRLNFAGDLSYIIQKCILKESYKTYQFAIDLAKLCRDFSMKCGDKLTKAELENLKSLALIAGYIYEAKARLYHNNVTYVISIEALIDILYLINDSESAQDSITILLDLSYHFILNLYRIYVAFLSQKLKAVIILRLIITNEYGKHNHDAYNLNSAMNILLSLARQIIHSAPQTEIDDDRREAIQVLLNSLHDKLLVLRKMEEINNEKYRETVSEHINNILSVLDVEQRNTIY